MSISGKLINETSMDWENLKCTESRKDRVNIPVLYRTFKEAEDACNKLFIGSMTGNFQVILILSQSRYFFFYICVVDPLNLML